VSLIRKLIDCSMGAGSEIEELVVGWIYRLRVDLREETRDWVRDSGYMTAI
jgi:hypothetical protein